MATNRYLSVRVHEITTNRLSLDSTGVAILLLSGRVTSPIETLLALVRAHHEGEVEIEIRLAPPADAPR